MTSDIFVPYLDGSLPPQISTRGDHPVPRQGITHQSGAIQTNKFYANFFLGNRTSSTWTHPYSVSWNKGAGPTQSWGIAISHTSQDQIVYGPGDPASYFYNPVGIYSIILSARELSASTSLTIDTLKAFSANVNLLTNVGANSAITFPLVQGMGFVTAVFNNVTPLLQSNISFKSIMSSDSVRGTRSIRYTIKLHDGTIWLVYLTPSSGTSLPVLTLLNGSSIVANQPFSGSIQVAKCPQAASIAIYDAAVGVYPLRGAVHASVARNEGQYSFTWTKGGEINRTLLMFALPHHVASFARETAAVVRHDLQLQTTTKGIATAVSADFWILAEPNIPFDMDFAPWSPKIGSQTSLTSQAASLITSIASTELNQDFDVQTNLDSMYFAGKGIAKLAMIVIAITNVAKNNGLGTIGLVKLKNVFARFVNNEQIYPLVYDSAWGGVVASGTYDTGDPGLDFGNAFYNDHHFHYGYFVYSAAVIASLDPAWLDEGNNKAWVDVLVRDYANSSTNDGYFPFSRMFDWYNGHSWAHGLSETADGKNQESSSEDGFASYALKMWGKVTSDSNMEARGNVMLAIQARSFDKYYLMQNNNTQGPKRFIGNKVCGILFENKMDHTTYFGTNIEYIEGIHMLPLNPSSALTRNPTFVREEWERYFSKGRVNTVQGGWRGILYANLALVDPKAAWDFFSRSDFSDTWLDGGASRTWCLVWCACLGGTG